MSNRGWQSGIIVHGIGTPGANVPADERPYWISVDQFQTLVDLIANSPNPTQTRLSFDDGNLSDHDIALPILVKHGLLAEFFVLTGRIGRPDSLNENHIKALMTAGMHVGSHGVNHVNWTQVNSQRLSQEMVASKDRLEDICGVPIISAAIPFGAYNGRVLRACKAAGYTRVYSSDQGRMRDGEYPAPRGSVQGHMSPETLGRLIRGELPALGAARRAVARLIKRF